MSDKIKILDNRDIDLSYNPESENAQSGKAVAEALEGFTPIDENQLVGKKTEQGGEIFNDYENNKALAENTSVSGIGNQAGYYGFPIASWVGIRISNDKKTASIFTNYTAVIDLYAVGDIIQLDIGSHFYNRYKIVKITESHDANGRTDGVDITIAPTYGEIITDDLSLSSDKTDNWFYVIGKYDWTAEFITHSAGASVRGKNNIAIGAQSDVSGKNNIAIGDLSTVTGRDNKAGYAAHAGGGYSEAMPSYSDTHGYRLKAGRNSQAVRGEWNAEDKDAFFVVGNGTSNTSRSNAFTVGRDGTAKVQSKLIVNDIDIGSKLYESPYVRVDELPESGDMDKVYLTPEGQYIYGYKEKDTDENIEIWDGSTRTAPKLVNGIYEITNGAELAYIVANGGREGAYYKLTKDIYLNDVSKIHWSDGIVSDDYSVRKWFQGWNWNPLGGIALGNSNPFKGTLDGNGCTIYGLYVNCKTTTFAESITYGAALIPRADKNVIIKNLAIDNCYINSQYIASAFVATVNGGGTLNFDNCYVGGNTYFSGNNIGIFVGQPQNSGCSVSITNSGCISSSYTNTTGNTGLYISTWGDITVKNCYSITPFSSNETVSGVLLQNCYQVYTDKWLKEGITHISNPNAVGLDVFTNPNKMPNLNTIPPCFIATEYYPELIVFACGWVQINEDKTEGIRAQVSDIDGRLSCVEYNTDIKGKVSGTSFEINDISSTPHYIKCSIENKDWGKDLIAEPVSFNDYKTKISLASLPRNYYYGINITFANGAVQQDIHMAIDDDNWRDDTSPIMTATGLDVTYSYLPENATLYIDKVAPEDVLDISIMASSSSQYFIPINLNDVVVNFEGENIRAAYFADEDGIVNNVKSDYPTVSVYADAPVIITCEYVKDTPFADIIGMIVPRYIDDNNI